MLLYKLVYKLCAYVFLLITPFPLVPSYMPSVMLSECSWCLDRMFI